MLFCDFFPVSVSSLSYATFFIRVSHNVMKTSSASRVGMVVCLLFVVSFINSCDTFLEAPLPERQENWRVWIAAAYPTSLSNAAVTNDTISFDITGINLDGCVPRTTFTHARNGNTFSVKCFFLPFEELISMQGPIYCTQAVTPFTQRVTLTVPSSGRYRVFLNPSPLNRPFDTTFIVP